MLRRGIVASVMILTLGACASGGGAGATAGAPAAPRYRANVITVDEIGTHQLASALDAVLQLRPQWNHVAVFLNGKRWGPFERLQEIPVANVQEIHRYTAEEARGKFGEEAHEAINVVLR